MDLRIVIVTNQSRQTIGRCLSSLSDACSGLDWDAVVVDNASSDGTVAEVERVVSNDRRLSVVANAENRGFAAACNQGFVGAAARFILLLNPDTVCSAGSLATLVREAEMRQSVGILGPKLLNEDGTVQTSIRRFPGFWDQLGITLKLHHVFPSMSVFRRYFANDVDLDREQMVDQVMGACFLIRKEVIDKIGGLDERYFVWFEEVDFCAMAKRAGWDIAYVPSASVVHGGGHSFAQVFPLRKQQFFNASLIAYADKWWGRYPAFVLRALNPVSLALALLAGRAGMAGRGGRKAFSSVVRDSRYTDSIPYWIAVIVVLEIISALTIFRNVANSIAVIVATGIIAAIAWKRPALALTVLTLELVIGSKGALLQLGGWPGTSLRICLFAAFFIGWSGNVVQHRRIGDIARLMRSRWEWLLLFIVVAYGVLRGLTLHQPYLVPDANAWGFALLILPVIDIAARDGLALRRYALSAIIAGIVWLAAKTLALEYVFSHGFSSIASDVYLWVRRSGIGEVTLITVNAFRIFMQSYIWVAVGLLGAIGWVFAHVGSAKCDRRDSLIASSVLIASAVSLAISLSRSIWMGTMAGLIILVVLMRRAVSIPAVLRIARDGIVAMALVAVVILFPIPKVDVGSLKSLFGSRLSVSDDAAASRWNLLPAVTAKIGEHPILGSGFGATVTYQSKDPRIVSQGKGGVITTYAFEWGWLEHGVKMGIFGMLMMLALVIGIARRACASHAESWVRMSSVAILVGLAVTHFFTPYLNHPLGLGVLMLVEAASLIAMDRTGSAIQA